jgi:hypothetical protein
METQVRTDWFRFYLSAADHTRFGFNWRMASMQRGIPEGASLLKRTDGDKDVYFIPPAIARSFPDFFLGYELEPCHPPDPLSVSTVG